MRREVALLGDSVFDNAAYVEPGEAVVDHLQKLLDDSHTWLLAVDGTTTGDFAPQVDKIPSSTTHVVLSLGGNDAIMNADLLDTPVSSTAEALALFGQRAEFFEVAYSRAVDAVLERNLPTCICTIYNGNLGPSEASAARVALCFFNDVILRTAVPRGLPVIDLRAICATPDDYANPIEPSARGGRKIAAAIARWLDHPAPMEDQSCRVTG